VFIWFHVLLVNLDFCLIWGSFWWNLTDTRRKFWPVFFCFREDSVGVQCFKYWLIQ